MMNQRPFIYIAALPRTGSTLLSELLTDLPRSFIFREPHIGKNDFQPKPGDIQFLQDNYNVDLLKLLKWRLRYAFLWRRLRWLHVPQDYMVRFLKNTLQSMLQQEGNLQIGVKEISQMGWQNYYKHFPNMKVIMTGRDPRDIYLSMYHRWKKDGAYQKYDLLNPIAMASILNHQFAYLVDIHRCTDSFKVKYDDLCSDESVIPKILRFVDSPLSVAGNIGQFLGTHPLRSREQEQHQGKITQISIGRWQKEQDNMALSVANQVYELMPEYREFWGYAK